MDIPDLLEFASAQFLELRYYDNYLTKAIDKTYGEMKLSANQMKPANWNVTALSAAAFWKPWPMSAV